MAPPRHLIVGLGNPGKEYAFTRHNVGFMAADAIAKAVGIKDWQRKFKGKIALGNFDGKNFAILKPMTFMNLSGESVAAALNFYKLSPEDAIVFHDDIDLQAGQIKVKQDGGNAGHNGLKSIDEHIGKNYWRVRIGIGRPENKDEVHEYVLSDFSKADRYWLELLLNNIAQNFSLLLETEKEKFAHELKKTG